MAIEIERRFLVRKDVRRFCWDGVRIRQGYLPSDGENTVRVRLAGDRGTIAVKSRRRGLCREEREYPIAAAAAVRLLRDSCREGLIEKTRYRVSHGGLCWEIDVFEGDNAGLIIAEVELSHPDQLVPLPDWVGAEISHVTAYSNSSLSRMPIRRWIAAA